MALRNISRASGFLSLDNIALFPPYGDTDKIFCAELPITSSEFANAGMLDIRASVSLAVDTESDRPEETVIKYEGKVYAIYRRYVMDNGITQLYLCERAGVS
jgi:hypothetical protein